MLKLPSDCYLGVILDDCLEAFMQLGLERGSHILLEILDSQTTPSIIFNLATALMGYNFGVEDYRVLDELLYRRYIEPEIICPDFPIKPVTELANELQRNVLSHLVAKDELWETQHNLFSVFGLPDSKEGMQSFIAS